MIERRRADPHAALARALVARPPGAAILFASTRPWASVTFTGAHHHIMLSVADPDRFCAGIDCDEFVLPGHILAEILVVGRTADTVTIQALTVEDQL